MDKGRTTEIDGHAYGHSEGTASDSVAPGDVLPTGEPTTQLYPELQAAYDFFNARLFNNALPPVLITLQRKHHTQGYWAPSQFSNKDGEKAGELALNPRFFAVRSAQETLATLVHQQVHVWQTYFGTAGRRGYHNKEWAEKMVAVGLHPSSTGMPGGAQTGEQVEHYVSPNGAFEAACSALMQSRGFEVTWYDRYPVFESTSSGASAQGAGLGDGTGVDDGPGTPEESGNTAATPLTALAAGMPATARISVGATSKPPQDAPSAAPCSVAALLLDKDQPARVFPGLDLMTHADSERDKPTRTKFTCPSCKSNAWGKSSLNIKCMDCDQPFRSEGKSENALNT